MSESASPLAWPMGWPRTKNPQRSRFGTYYNKPSVAKSTNALLLELQRLGAVHPIVSTNLALRLDGTPRSGQGEPSDTGAAVYFTLKGKRLVLACDKWSTVGDNIWAISCHIEAMRGQQRWGVGSVEQAFAGYARLEHRTEPAWWEVLGIPEASNETQILDAYRRKAREVHPDVGGSAEEFAKVVRAKDTALGKVA